MQANPPKSSELILNEDGSIYHLQLHPEDIADNVIVVGDPDRVALISQHFDRITVKKQNREFVTHSGYIGSTFLTVLSTGIGTDNIDIVLNELDAAVNIDFSTRLVRKELRKLNIIRVGTSGGLHPSIALNSFLVSEYSIGLDGLLHYYQWDPTGNENTLAKELTQHFGWPTAMAEPYAVKGAESLLNLFSECEKGITLTAGGFYAPQGRELRLPLAVQQFHERIESFRWNNRFLTNFEMESAAIYALGSLLGHNCVTVCAIIANRATGQFSEQHHQAVERLIDYVLGKLTS